MRAPSGSLCPRSGLNCGDDMESKPTNGADEPPVNDKVARPDAGNTSLVPPGSTTPNSFNWRDRFRNRSNAEKLAGPAAENTAAGVGAESPTTDQQTGNELPQWQSVPLDQSDLHPYLQHLDPKPGVRFPHEWQKGYLTPTGIKQLARYSPIHVVKSGTKFLCFSGVRLWLAATNECPPLAEIEVLVHPSITEIQIQEALEMEAEILPVWYRLDEKEGIALDMRILGTESLNKFRLKFEGREQNKWSSNLRMSLKTLQNRLDFLRRKA